MARIPTIKNLKPIKKGQVLNPKGRPKGTKNRSTIARQILAMRGALPDQIFESLKKLFPGITKNMSIEEIMTIKMTQQAITKGDTQAYKAVMDSGYGNPNQSLSGPDGEPIKHEAIKKTFDDDHLKGVFETAIKVLKDDSK